MIGKIKFHERHPGLVVFVVGSVFILGSLAILQALIN